LSTTYGGSINAMTVRLCHLAAERLNLKKDAGDREVEYHGVVEDELWLVAEDG
jgi:hypothetical protein